VINSGSAFKIFYGSVLIFSWKAYLETILQNTRTKKESKSFDMKYHFKLEAIADIQYFLLPVVSFLKSILWFRINMNREFERALQRGSNLILDWLTVLESLAGSANQDP